MTERWVKATLWDGEESWINMAVVQSIYLGGNEIDGHYTALETEGAERRVREPPEHFLPRTPTECEKCGKIYLTGPNTGRRSHSKFCSDRCRVAANREKHK